MSSLIQNIRNNRYGLILLVLYIGTYVIISKSGSIARFLEKIIYDSDTILISQQIKRKFYLCHTVLIIICIGFASVSKAYVLTKIGYFLLLFVWLLFLLFLMGTGVGMMS